MQRLLCHTELALSTGKFAALVNSLFPQDAVPPQDNRLHKYLKDEHDPPNWLQLTDVVDPDFKLRFRIPGSRRTKMLTCTSDESATRERQSTDLLGAVPKNTKQNRHGVNEATDVERIKDARYQLPQVKPQTIDKWQAGLSTQPQTGMTPTFLRRNVANAAQNQTVLRTFPEGGSSDTCLMASQTIWHVRCQAACGNLSIPVDEEFAGCLSTRRSTSG